MLKMVSSRGSLVIMRGKRAIEPMFCEDKLFLVKLSC